MVTPARPTKPVPKRSIVAGSGTGSAISLVIEIWQIPGQLLLDISGCNIVSSEYDIVRV